jgi:RNA polymerase sigma-70 factor (ECF subfamily)
MQPTEPLPEGPAETPEPLQEVLAPVDALADCLTRALGEPSPDDASILRACDLEGQTQRAFAQTHGLDLRATNSRLLRTRQRLRERLTTACQVRFVADGSVAGHVPRAPVD